MRKNFMRIEIHSITESDSHKRKLLGYPINKNNLNERNSTVSTQRTAHYNDAVHSLPCNAVGFSSKVAAIFITAQQYS